MSSSAPTPEYGAPWLPVTGRCQPRALVQHGLVDSDDRETPLAELEADTRADWQAELGGDVEPVN